MSRFDPDFFLGRHLFDLLCTRPGRYSRWKAARQLSIKVWQNLLRVTTLLDLLRGSPEHSNSAGNTLSQRHPSVFKSTSRFKISRFKIFFFVARKMSKMSNWIHPAAFMTVLRLSTMWIISICSDTNSDVRNLSGLPIVKRMYICFILCDIILFCII
jgi:hypothetical protein